jgi:serine/threonine protein phosphatase PrpC
MIRVAAWTHVGLVRTRNEDAVALPGVVLAGVPPFPVSVDLPVKDGSAPPLTLAAIDGMGGHAGGVEASRLIALQLAETSGEITEALAAINDAVYDEMERRPELTAMGATVAGIQVRIGEATVFNVGDARVYVHEGGYSRVVSTDDRGAGASNVITQSLGGTPQRTRINVHTSVVDLSAPVRFLICTDGLSEYVKHENIQGALDTPDLRNTAWQLVNLAYQAGAPDNVSVVVADWSPPADESA